MIAIIVAAGSSRRMGFDKLFSPLAGEPVLVHSIRAFDEAPSVERIVIVTKPERMDTVRQLGETFAKFEKVVAGGAERHDSVWAGLQAFDPRSFHYVAIHDGARPLITPEAIEACMELAQEHGGACCAAPVSDTVKRASPAQIVTGSVDRTGLWAMQTPQVFRTSLILDAYEAVMKQGELVTDEVSALQMRGKPVALMRNDDWNLKVTFPRDLEMAAHVLSIRAKARAKVAGEQAF